MSGVTVVLILPVVASRTAGLPAAHLPPLAGIARPPFTR